MIYLFGNYRALGELGAIDKESQERVGRKGSGAQRFNTSSHLGARLCSYSCLCLYVCVCVCV